MALSEEDMRRIESLGYKRESFAVESKGFVILKNVNHRCVLHDGTRCTIYDTRPRGCRLYPVVFAEYSGRSTMDRMCPFWSEFSYTPESSRESKNLHRQLIEEARKRKRSRIPVPKSAHD